MEKVIFHHGIDEKKAHSDTRVVRNTDWRTAPWYSTSQVWSWDDGACDAIVVVTGELGNVRGYTVIRMGTRVEVVEGSLDSTMRAFGYEPKDYVIRGES